MLRNDRVNAKAGLKFIEPRFVPWVHFFTRLACPTYLRLIEGISKVETAGIENLIHSYQQFYQGKARVLVAFRHPSVHDPPVMVYLLCRLLPAAARRSGLKLGGKGHAHFLYGRGVLNWAGGGAAFLIPRIAGISPMDIFPYAWPRRGRSATTTTAWVRSKAGLPAWLFGASRIWNGRTGRKRSSSPRWLVITCTQTNRNNCSID
jgi:hypothetical protein